MSRHSKNNTAHSFFTYYEKKKVKDSGTLTSRVEGESLRRFEDCWLCLSLANNPVCTLSGCIYCRECLMQNLDVQRNTNQRRYQEWEAENIKAFQKKRHREEADQQQEIHNFIQANRVILDHHDDSAYRTLSPRAKKQQVAPDKSASRSASFWIVENTPDLSNPPSSTIAVDAAPPTRHFFCPVSKKRLRLKQILPLHPTRQPQISTHLNEEKQDSWICALTKKQIGCKHAIALKPTGQIVLEECYKENLLDGFIPTHPKITEQDIIRLIPGGTSFAAHNKVQVKILRPVME